MTRINIVSFRRLEMRDFIQPAFSSHWDNLVFALRPRSKPWKNLRYPLDNHRQGVIYL
jgi:hypothetical protein